MIMYVCGGRTRYVCIRGEDYYVCKRGGGLIMYARGGMIHYVCKKGEDSLCMHEGGRTHYVCKRGRHSLCIQGSVTESYTSHNISKASLGNLFVINKVFYMKCGLTQQLPT